MAAEDIVAEELEESLGEVVKFLEVGVLDLQSERGNGAHLCASLSTPTGNSASRKHLRRTKQLVYIYRNSLIMSTAVRHFSFS